MNADRLKRKSRGTPDLPKDDERYVCGLCHNSGVAETTKGRLVACQCGQPIVGHDGRKEVGQ